MRTISSGATSFFKMWALVISVLAGMFCLVEPIAALAEPRLPSPLALLPLLGCWLAWMWAQRQLTIQLDPEFLHVSAFRRVVRIPRSEIVAVKVHWQGGRPPEFVDSPRRWWLSIAFRSPTPFGHRIRFWPADQSASPSILVQELHPPSIQPAPALRLPQ